MIGLPTQTIEEVEESVNSVLELEPEHISVYSLILEEGTILEKKVKEGIVSLPEDEKERQMYWLVKERLEKNGYEHYEISNFAKKGKKAKHNLDCWDQKEYIGFGVAAHSYIDKIRYSNIEKIDEYVKHIQEKQIYANYILQEKQTIESQKEEFMLLGLRKLEGVSMQAFKNKFAENPLIVYQKELNKLHQEGLIQIDLDKIRLTDKGIDLANLVWEEFVS